MGLVCTGYRDTRSLRFCDETGPVTQKVRVKSTGSASSNETPEPSEALQIVKNPPPSSNDFAEGYFSAHYAFFPHVLKGPETDARAALLDCAKALGFATCAQVEKNDPALWNLAKGFYVSALSRTNAVLRSAAHVRDDATIYAVMLLTNYETLAATDKTSWSEAWTQHIKGATALLGQRGRPQFESPTSRLLFMHCTANLVSNCIRTAARVPAEVYRLATMPDDADGWGPTNLVWSLQMARLQIVDLYSDVAAQRVDRPAASICHALALDNQLLLGFEKLRTTESNMTITYDAFRWYQSQGLQQMRTCRVMLHLIVIKMLRDLRGSPMLADSLRKEDQIEASLAVIRQLQDELINAGERQLALTRDQTIHFDMYSADRNYAFSPQASVSNAALLMADTSLIARLDGGPELDLQSSPQILRLSLGYAVIWGTIIAGQLTAGSKLQRDRACESLRRLGKAFRITQAPIMADILEAS